MKRILFYCHYNPNGSLSEYVLDTMKKITPFFKKVIFISNSPLSINHRNNLKIQCNKIIIRENKGFDFGAWKDAIIDEGWNELLRYDNVTLMNDSCFGPLFDLNNLFSKMETEDTDFWGITNHGYLKDGHKNLFINKSIPEHIQSYYLCFNSKVVKSNIFQNFWKKVKNHSQIDNVINEYEIRLTLLLKKEGFNYNVYIDTTSFKCENKNLATWHPDILLKYGMPFIKIKSFIVFEHPVYLKKMINNVSDYDIRLIERHFSSVYNPNISLKINNKILICDSEASLSDKAKKFKIAIHLHVYYINVFIKYVLIFKKINLSFDLYITTDTPAKKKTIELILLQNSLIHLIKKIEIFENRGRDILPWILMQKYLYKYDFVGHFHTKKSITVDEWVGKSWQNEIFEELLLPVNNILNYITENDNIGIVIFDVPYFFKKHWQKDIWDKNEKIFYELWIKMKCKKKIDTANIITPIMSYGTMFWYKPPALKPLFDLNLAPENFPDEPLPINNSILHALERLLVYIAWNQDYDYIISMNKEYIRSFMSYKNENIFNTKNKKSILNYLKHYLLTKLL